MTKPEPNERLLNYIAALQEAINALQAKIDRQAGAATQALHCLEQAYQAAHLRDAKKTLTYIAAAMEALAE